MGLREPDPSYNDVIISVAAVIFDLDGTLLDSERVFELAFRDYMGGIGRTDAEELFALAVGRRRVDCLIDLSATVARPEGEIDRGLRAAMGERIERGELQPTPFAAESVERLSARWRLGLASSSLRGYVDRSLAELGVADRFAAVVCGDEVGRGKPHPEPYAKVAEMLGVATDRCVAIEDSAPGITAAVAAGMTCIAVPPT